MSRIHRATISFSLLLAMMIACNFANHVEAFEHDTASTGVTVYGNFFNTLKDKAWNVSQIPLSIFKNVTESLDNPTKIVLKIFSSVIALAEEYVHTVLSIILFFIVMLVDSVMWRVNISFIRIMQFDSILFLGYTVCGPTFVIKYFISFLSITYYLLYTLIVTEYRICTAVIFCALSFYEYWIWSIPKVLKASVPNRIIEKITMSGKAMPTYLKKLFKALATYLKKLLNSQTPKGKKK